MRKISILTIASCLLLTACASNYSDRTKYETEKTITKERTKHNYYVPGASEIHTTPANMPHVHYIPPVH